MKVISTTILIAITIIVSTQLFAQQNYNIEFKIKGLENKDIMLVRYYGNKNYVNDTLHLDKKGSVVFSADSLYDQGIYIVLTPSKKHFEFIIGEDQTFSIETDTSDLINNIKISGSEETKAFQDYQIYMGEQQNISITLQDRYKKNQSNPDSVALLRRHLDDLNQKMVVYWSSIAMEYEGKMLGLIAKSMITPTIPEFEIPDHIQNKDSMRWFLGYTYNKEHFLDNIDLSDSRSLRIITVHNKIDHFYKRLLPQIPDTLITYSDKVLEKTNGNEETFGYILRYLYNGAVQSEIMGMDKLMVHLAEKYYLSGKVDWVDDETMEKIRDRVMKLKPNLIGETAQDLKLENIYGEFERLHDINAKFTLIYFWEPDCGHCKKTTPKVWDLYQKYDRSQFEVFAVYTMVDKEEWNEYISKYNYEWINVYDPYHLSNFRFYYDIYSTPTLYLIDNNKKIIAKRFSHETLAKILEYELEK